MDRKITFGKYKGEDIKKLILTHTGYIMWCLENISWFKLNEDEQKLYDAMALSVLESDVDTVYPKQKLKLFISDLEAKALFHITDSGVIYPNSGELENPVVKGVMKYKVKSENRGRKLDLGGLMGQVVKMFISGGDDMVDYDDF